MNKKEKTLAMVLALLLVLFGFLIWFYLAKNGAWKTGQPRVGEAQFKLNNTLKTSVTVLPAPKP